MYYKLEGGPVVVSYNEPQPQEDPHLCIRGLHIPREHRPAHYVGTVWIDKNGVDDHMITPKNWARIIRGMRTHEDIRDFASALFEKLGLHTTQVRNLVSILAEGTDSIHELPITPAHFKSNGTTFTHASEGYTLTHKGTTYHFDDHLRLTKENENNTPTEQLHDATWVKEQRRELTTLLLNILETGT